MVDKKYPQWIDELAKSIHQAFSNMMPTSWSSLDGFAVFAAQNGTFLSKIHQAILEIKKKDYRVGEIAKTFSCASSLRCCILFLTYEYIQCNPKNKKQFREIVEFLIEVLRFMVKDDLFCYNSNIVHTKKEIEQILNGTKWTNGSPATAREIGKLYNSLASLSFSLYRDYFPQDSHEIYGPYPADFAFQKGTILLIKHFPKIKPVELWPNLEQEKYSDVKIYQIFKNVKFRCEMIGMHSIYEGDLMNGLVTYAVIADGKYYNKTEQIKELSYYFSELATKQWGEYDKLTIDDYKKKILEWECYQFFNFFKLAQMDWQPTPEMLSAVKNKKIKIGVKQDSFPSFKEYITNPEYEIYWLKDLYK